MPNTTITQFGLDYVSSASPVGTLIAPLYFVPVYDSRIDSLIHDNNIPVSAFSACVEVSATAPTGEMIWNVDGITNRYYLSDENDNFIIKGPNTSSSPDPIPSGGHETILKPVQSQKWQINTRNHVPLADHYHGTSAVFSAAGASSTWAMDGCTISAGVNPTPAGLEKYFPVTDYYPVSANTPDSQLRGQIKCRLTSDIGTVKFNKVAVYIQKFDMYGTPSTDEPVFFAECQLKTTVVKTSMGTNGFDDLTVDMELDLHSISANWAEVFFSTSGDYWSRCPDGLYYPERVGIGSFIDSILSPQASLHVRMTRQEALLSATEIPISRFDFDDNNYIETDINSNGLVNQIFQQGSGTYAIELIYDAAVGSIYPRYSYSIGLGSIPKRFASIFLGPNGVDIRDTSSFGYIQNYFDNGGFAEYSDNVAMDFIPISNINPQTSAIARIMGADIGRTDEPLIIYSIKGTSEPEIDIMTDLDPTAYAGNAWGYSGTPLPTGQYGITHKNILWQIANDPTLGFMGNNGKVRIYGKGMVDIHGPISIDCATYISGYSIYDYGLIDSSRTNILLVAGIRDSASHILGTVDTWLNNPGTPAGNAAWNTITTTQMLPAARFIMLGNITDFGNISPPIGDTYSLGTPGLRNLSFIQTQVQLRYNKLIVNTIGAFTGEYFDATHTYQDNRVTAIYVKDVGTAQYSRTNRLAITGVIDHSAMDVGLVSTDTTYGDHSYPGGTEYPTFYGIWPKTYITLGNGFDFLNVLSTSLNAEDTQTPMSGGRTIWQAYINNITVSHGIVLTGALRIIGWAYGINGPANKGGPGFLPYDSGDPHQLPGIHVDNDDTPVVIGDSDYPIDSIYTAYEEIYHLNLIPGGQVVGAAAVYTQVSGSSNNAVLENYSVIMSIPSGSDRVYVNCDVVISGGFSGDIIFSDFGWPTSDDYALGLNLLFTFSGFAYTYAISGIANNLSPDITPTSPGGPIGNIILKHSGIIHAWLFNFSLPLNYKVRISGTIDFSKRPT